MVDTEWGQVVLVDGLVVVDVMVVLPVLLDELCSTLTYHDGCDVGVATDGQGSDAHVGHPQVLKSVHLESGTDHGVRVGVGTHLAGAARVV